MLDAPPPAGKLLDKLSCADVDRLIFSNRYCSHPHSLYPTAWDKKKNVGQSSCDVKRGEEELTVKVFDIMRDTLDNKLISNYYELPTYIRV